jgi:hypothetical protein
MASLEHPEPKKRAASKSLTVLCFADIYLLVYHSSSSKHNKSAFLKIFMSAMTVRYVPATSSPLQPKKQNIEPQ